jgi:hypothetical protein
MKNAEMQDANTSGDSRKNLSTPDPKADKSQANPSASKLKKQSPAKHSQFT